MAESAEEAYFKINGHIEKQGGAHSDWYCGIASNIEDQLFYDHNVSRENDLWVDSECESSGTARAVRKALLELGCDGGRGGEDEDSIYVYAYLKSSATVP